MNPENSDNPLPRLTAQQEEFCQQILFDGIATKAARRAGFPEKAVRKRASDLMKRPQIVARIEELRAERRERLQVDGDSQLRDMLEMLQVDANELVEYRRVNCRRCWGIGHRHQWGIVEAEEAQERHDRLTEKQRESVDAPDFTGGTEFNPWKEPNPCCPNCGGEGESRPYFHDTRTLSPAARRLYEGVHVSRDGTKMLMVDRAGLQDKINRALGLYKDKVELTGKDGGEIKIGLGHFYGGDD